MQIKIIILDLIYDLSLLVPICFTSSGIQNMKNKKKKLLCWVSWQSYPQTMAPWL
jgi:hypothetical protein